MSSTKSLAGHASYARDQLRRSWSRFLHASLCLSVSLVALAACLFVSCREPEAQEEEPAVPHVVCSLPSISTIDMNVPYGGTRMEVSNEATDGGNNYQFHWADGDEVGIFPERGTQVSFAMSDDEGGASAVFDGGGWRLKKDMHYAAYYPLQPEFYLDPTNIPLDLTQLVQKGNGMQSSDRPAVMSILYSSACMPDSKGHLEFMLHHVVSVLHFRINVPKSGGYTAVRLVTDGDFVTKANLNCFAEVNNVTPQATAHELTLQLKDVSVSHIGDDTYLDVFFPFIPVNLSGKTLCVEVQYANGVKYSTEARTIDYTQYAAGTFFNYSPSEAGLNFRVEVDFTADESRLVANPHKGWYHHLYDINPQKYGIDNTETNIISQGRFPNLDHLYVRLSWSYFNPNENEYDWSYIDNTITNYCIRYNLGLSLRIPCRTTGAVGQLVEDCIHFSTDADVLVTNCRYSETQNYIKTSNTNYGDQRSYDTAHDCYFATPYWVVKKIGNTKPYGSVICDAGSGRFSWIPDYGNKVFLEELEKFHKALVKHLQDKDYVKYLRYVDVGSLGDWGEGHTSSSTKTQIDDEVIKEHYDLYQRCYGELDVPIIIPENSMAYERGDDPWIIGGPISSEIEPLMNYGKNLGMGLRYDSYLVDWQLGRNEPNKFHYSVLRPYMFENFYQNNLIVHEQEHYENIVEDGHWKTPNGVGKIDVKAHKSKTPDYNQVYSGQEIFLKSLELTHPTYIGYHGDMSTYLNDNPQFVIDAANKCGYWLRPVHASLKGEKLTVQWINKGVAPCFYTYQLRIHYVVNGREYGTQIIDDSRNTTWMPAVITWQSYPELVDPERTYEETYDIVYPDGIEQTDFDMYMELYDPDTQKSIDVSLANSQFKSGTKWIKIGSFTANTAQ